MKSDFVSIGRASAFVHWEAAISNAIHYRGAKPPDSIITIDPRPCGMGGSAHSDPSQCFRINMREELHDIPSETPLSEYIRSRGGIPGEPQPRNILAGYLAAVERKATAYLGSLGCHVRHLVDTAIRMDRRGDDYKILLKSGRKIVARTVILATGNEPPSVPADLPSNAPVTCYDGGSSFARDISRSDRVLIIGSGPGAIDVERYLIEEIGIVSPVHMRSGNGWLSAVQTIAPVEPELIAAARRMAQSLRAARPYSLERLASTCGAFIVARDGQFDYERIMESQLSPLDQLRQDITDAHINGPAWRLALEAVGVCVPELWAGLNEEGRERFVRNKRVLRQYYCKRHAMPLPTAEWLEWQMSTGRITLSSGSVECPVHTRIVIATGPEYRVTRTRNPLLRYLLDSGQAKPYMAGNTELGGLAMTDFQVDGMPNVYAMGALARGQYFAVHSFPALATHARAIVDQLMVDQLKARK